VGMRHHLRLLGNLIGPPRPLGEEFVSKKANEFLAIGEEFVSNFASSSPFMCNLADSKAQRLVVFN